MIAATANAPLATVAPHGSDTPARDADDRSEETRKRVAIEFSKEAYERLSSTREASGATSNAEVIRNALRLYDFLLQNRRQGWAIHLVKDNHVKELELLV